MLQEQRNALVERMERDHLLVTRPFIEEVTPFSFLYEPHTVTALLLMLVTMCYVAFVRPPTDNLDEGVKLCVLCCALQLSRPLVAVHVADIHTGCLYGRGLATAVGVFLVYCVVQLRDSMMLRPHPALWWVWGMHPIQRVHVCATWRFLLACVDRSIGVGVWDHRRFVHGCFILYLLGLVFLLCQVRACLGCDPAACASPPSMLLSELRQRESRARVLGPRAEEQHLLAVPDAVCRGLPCAHVRPRRRPGSCAKGGPDVRYFHARAFPWSVIAIVAVAVLRVTNMWCCANIGRVGGESTYHEGLDIVVDPVHPVGACRVLLPAPHAQFPRVLVGSLDPGCAGMQFWRHGCRHGHVPPLCECVSCSVVWCSGLCTLCSCLCCDCASTPRRSRNASERVQLDRCQARQHDV